MTIFENMMKRHDHNPKLVVANAMLENNTINNYENTGYVAYSGMDGYKYINPIRESDSVLPLTIDEIIRISKVFTEPCTMVCKDDDDAKNRCLQTYIDFLNSQISNENEEDIDDYIPDITEISPREFSEKYRSIDNVDMIYNPLEVINSQGRLIVLNGYLLDYVFWTADASIFDEVVRNDLFDTHDIEHIVYIKYTPKITRGDSIKIN